MSDNIVYSKWSIQWSYIVHEYKDSLDELCKCAETYKTDSVKYWLNATLTKKKSKQKKYNDLLDYLVDGYIKQDVDYFIIYLRKIIIRYLMVPLHKYRIECVSIDGSIPLTPLTDSEFDD